MNKAMIKVFSVLLLVGALLVACIETSLAKTYPTKPIRVLVGFGAGGPTDLIARGILPIMQERLGQPIVITNMPGAAGATAAASVFAAARDGYTLLYGTETMSVWQVMGVSDLSPRDFIPIRLTNQAIPVLAVPPDSKFTTMEELISFARANPGRLRMSTAGPGTVPHVSGMKLTDVLGARFTFVPFAGGRPAINAVMGGHVDATIEMVQAMADNFRAKQLRILGSFTNDPIPGLEEIPPAGKLFPELAKYLPYGPYFGLMAAAGTPPEIIKVLESAMGEAMRDPRWPEYQARIFLRPINLSGRAAVDFIEDWTSRSAWIIYDNEGAKHSPAKFGIKRPAK